MSTAAAEPDRPKADPAAVDRLMDMDDDEFGQVVADDARFALDDRALVIALRDDDVLDEWQDALTALYMRINGQFAEKKGQNDLETRRWRKNANRVLAGVVARKKECKALTADRNRREHPTAQGRPQPLAGAPARIAIPGREGVANTPEARAAAGELAAKRLMDAHPEEWLDLLAQEYGKAGLPVKAHWIKGIDA